MRCFWVFLLVSIASCVAAPTTTEVADHVATATTARPPRRTLDRQAAELAWRSWLQSPESGNQNAPPRRITTKSLFITPIVCPKGQRLDKNGCVQLVTVNKDEHERILLEQLNSIFTSAPSADVLYDYGDDEPGPLQLSIPIGLEPQAAPLFANEQPEQTQQTLNVKVDKKDENKFDASVGIAAELELMKLQTESHNRNISDANKTEILHNNNVLPFAEKPKRDSPIINETPDTGNNFTDVGQKELVYGQVNDDPILYYQNQQYTTSSAQDVETETAEPTNAPTETDSDASEMSTFIDIEASTTEAYEVKILNKTKKEDQVNEHKLKVADDKISPEKEFSNIGEAIKLISRYAEVTTDDNFSKTQNKQPENENGVLGTRTKLQHRRTKQKDAESTAKPTQFPISSAEQRNAQLPLTHSFYPKSETYYRYPWFSDHSSTPPPEYPFRHVQDYWGGRTQIGGVYSGPHENPRRHHHTFPQTNYRVHNGPYYPNQFYGPYYQGKPFALAPNRNDPRLPQSNTQDLYSLLGLRHWFSSEGNAKR